ncbi:hypothetical protein GLOTRDRAFT_116906 [Gloeophyllum trabeum ATCC 11539]|uniref:Pyridoxamine 5'-phosphate oxidase Alr4036 family FMN-binding domain-containing protein n=1 Tax=Gloeophyllum trabeum (strain ATCC 11539 / FP-39264 / Madison 617) TaxID=670483 RepID=S7Q1K3_GLOTA|nr:uncharacterized protein GLOTRDRAFT_116906 [Gloeophyllum trabeum ATCC 11539]EPQ53402.1 hypothetical protein GLOTRDRAFT_116906 [Gloeophyllum trabeum ATCC 11539]
MASPLWLRALHKTLNKHDKVSVFQLATFDAQNVPHARSQIYRTTFTPQSHPNYPLLISSTDIRTPKVSELISNPTNPSSSSEMCWWIDKTSEQFRITSRTYVIHSPSHPFYARFDWKTLPRMKALVEEDKVDWEAKWKEMYESMSGHMKASWLRPPPGSVLEGGYEESKKWVEKRALWEKAFSNFALMVVEPVRVDYLEMGIVPNRRRV